MTLDVVQMLTAMYRFDIEFVFAFIVYIVLHHIALNEAYEREFREKIMERF